MTRKCELTQKGVLSGNSVSHSNRKNPRKFLPNLHSISFFSPVLCVRVTFKVCKTALREIAKAGSIDDYLVVADNKKLSSHALRIKKVIMKKKISNQMFF